MTTISITPILRGVNPNVYLDPKTRSIYRLAVNLSKTHGHAWITNEAIATEFGKSVSTAKRYIRILRDLGLVRTIVDCKNKFAKRKIFCIVPLNALRPGGFVVKNEPDFGSEMNTNQVDPLPIEELTRENNQQDTTPLSLPDPTPCPSVVVIPDCVSEDTESHIIILEDVAKPVSNSTLHRQHQNENMKVLSKDASSVPSPPMPTVNHPQTTETALCVAKNLQEQGVVPFAICVQLATDFPDACRQHLATFRPELHHTPGGYLRWAITNGIAPDKPKPKERVTSWKRPRTEPDAMPSKMPCTPRQTVSAVSDDVQEMKAILGGFVWRKKNWNASD